MSEQSYQNVLWSLHGFLKGLDTSKLNDDSIEPNKRTVTMSKKQYEDIERFIYNHLNIKGNNK